MSNPDIGMRSKDVEMTDIEITIIRSRTTVLERELRKCEDQRNSLIEQLGRNYKLIMGHHANNDSKHNVSGDHRR